MLLDNREGIPIGIDGSGLQPVGLWRLKSADVWM